MCSRVCVRVFKACASRLRRLPPRGAGRAGAVRLFARARARLRAAGGRRAPISPGLKKGPGRRGAAGRTSEGGGGARGAMDSDWGKVEGGGGGHPINKNLYGICSIARICIEPVA
jgi:hypothetical protein